MVKKLPPRPIAGGTNDGARLRRFDYWRTGYGTGLPDKLDFYVAQAGEFHAKPHYQTNSSEMTPQTQIFYHTSGEATVRYLDRRLAVAGGDLLITPPDQPFTYESRGGAKYYWLGLEGDWPRALGPPEMRVLALGYDARIETLFVEVREILILRKPGYPLQAIGVLYELAARIEEITRSAEWPESSYPEAVRNAIDFLRENSYGPYEAAETAAAVGLSQSHLRALFEKWLGESPGRFHMRCRIELAKRLLSEQGLSGVEIAAHLGFSDVHHFSRAFKQTTGLSPTQYLHQQ